MTNSFLDWLYWCIVCPIERFFRRIKEFLLGNDDDNRWDRFGGIIH